MHNPTTHLHVQAHMPCLPTHTHAHLCTPSCSRPAAGSYAATIVSEHGRELEALDLPDSPTQPLVVADFNFDGYNDIILLGKVRARCAAAGPLDFPWMHPVVAG